ncbi:MAG: hypothetical protein E6Q97_16055 [Desulfurellales bacterium]|nr:MAG: hypothetical protein E6Q97_16055 [Desulfurellales bacterium]
MPEWVESQMRTLIDAGLPAVDAHGALRWVIDHLPAGADAQTWTPTPDRLMTALDMRDVADARAAWYAERPGWARRLLDARE